MTDDELLILAVREGDLAEVKKRVIQGKQDTAIKDYEENTLLHLAIQGQQDAIAQFLLDEAIYFGQKFFLPNRYGNTPLHEAVIAGNASMVEKLILAGCDVNQVNGARETPLHKAVDKPGVFKKFLSCPMLDPNKRDKQGRTVLDLLVILAGFYNVEKKEAEKRENEELQNMLGLYANSIVKSILEKPIGESEAVKQKAQFVAQANKKIFISYSWHLQHGTRLMVNDFDCFLKRLGISYYRDISPEGDYGLVPGMHIETFMKKAQEADCVVIFLNEEYLKSRNCLFELMQVWDIRNRRLSPNTYVIRHPEARIFGQGDVHLPYQEHWGKLLADIESKKNSCDAADLRVLIDEVEFRRTVKQEMQHIVQYLSSHILKDYSEIRADGFIDILNCMGQISAEMNEKERETQARAVRELERMSLSTPGATTRQQGPPQPIYGTQAAVMRYSSNPELDATARMTAERLAPELISACMIGDMETVQTLVSQGADLALGHKNDSEQFRNTPFSAAVYSTYEPLVDYIVERLQARKLYPDYSEAAKINVANYGSRFWKYPEIAGNQVSLEVSELISWFESIPQRSFFIRLYMGDHKVGEIPFVLMRSKKWPHAKVKRPKTVEAADLRSKSTEDKPDWYKAYVVLSNTCKGWAEELARRIDGCSLRLSK